MILIDTHVHLHSCFEAAKFLQAAAENFNSVATEFCPGEPYQGVLCLADHPNCEAFDRLRRLSSRRMNMDGWSIKPTDEAISLIASHQRLGHLTVMAGRQILCKENIELLLLCTGQAFENRIGLQAAFERAQAGGAVTILPWAFGKWLGRRGKMLRRFMQDRTPDQLSLGDNGGRPAFWREPAEFARARRRGFRVLPGSDPLPFPSEVSRVASYGLMVSGCVNAAQPARDVSAVLADPNLPIRPFGQLERPLRFVRNQLTMQVRKRQRRRSC